MKFMNFLAFDKHLKQSYPNHLAPCYALIVIDEEERQSISKSVIALLKKAHPDLTVLKTKELDVVLTELHSPSLLGDLPLIYFDQVHKLTKKQWPQLLAAIGSLPDRAHLILGLQNIKGCPDLAKESKRTLVTLDLSKEKPWDKDKRIADQLLMKAASFNKTLARDALDYLLQAVGPELTFLESALEKLSIYVGDENIIDLKAARSLVRPSKEQTTWQIAEGLVWDKRIPRKIDSKDFPMLIGSLRYQLELGLCIATDPSLLSTRYKTLRPRTLSRCQSFGYSSAYFQNGLKALLDAERAFKNRVSDGSLCFDLFAGKLLR